MNRDDVNPAAPWQSAASCLAHPEEWGGMMKPGEIALEVCDAVEGADAVKHKLVPQILHCYGQRCRNRCHTVRKHRRCA